MQKSKSLALALIPVVFLIAMLSINVLGVYQDDALAGSNQFILLLSGALAALLGIGSGTAWKDILGGIEHNIQSTTGALLILLLIGALAGSWMLSGIVPAMVYYGLQLLNPQYFLPLTALICAVISLATGSSWSTTATVGIALIGIGRAMGLHEAMVAGSVVSGAYFGDKLSPLSDTTNLAPAMAGTDLFTHIRYLLITTVPSFSLALLLFFALGFFNPAALPTTDMAPILTELEQTFNLTPWLFAVPALVIVLIVRKVPALPALLVGTLAGVLFALLFQGPLLLELAQGGHWQAQYRLVMDALTVSVQYPARHPVLAELLSSGGMSGMLGTIWLILSAMVFGGAMEASGFLAAISGALLGLARGTFSLIATTTGTCLVANITASDQYLAIVVPGRMYAPAFRQMGLAPENLSRTLEDSGTVTSVLIPWNTCGAYQSKVLGVEVWAYLPYAFFNWLSPIMTLLVAAIGFKIRKLRPQKS